MFCQAAICSNGLIWQTVKLSINGQFDICPSEPTFMPKWPAPKILIIKNAKIPRSKICLAILLKIKEVIYLA